MVVAHRLVLRGSRGRLAWIRSPAAGRTKERCKRANSRRGSTLFHFVGDQANDPGVFIHVRTLHSLLSLRHNIIILNVAAANQRLPARALPCQSNTWPCLPPPQHHNRFGDSRDLCLPSTTSSSSLQVFTGHCVDLPRVSYRSMDARLGLGCRIVGNLQFQWRLVSWAASAYSTVFECLRYCVKAAAISQICAAQWRRDGLVLL